MIYNSITELVGKTPLLRLLAIEDEFSLQAEIVAKLECFNPLSSAKDRVGLRLVKDALEDGRANKDTCFIEPTSGNTGIGIAMACAVYKLKATIVMPDSMSVERRKVMQQLGAELVLTEGKLGMQGAIDKANELCKERENAIVLGQFYNKANPLAHYDTTAPEIYSATNGKIDIFVAGIGTGGTISGVGKYLKEQNKNIKVYGVEPFESPVITKGVSGAHLIQGIGANFVPQNLDMSVVDSVLTVKGEDAISFSKLLARLEGVLCGISSGAALCAAVELAKKPENIGKRIVVFLPDGGDRYTSTKLF